SVVQCLAGSRTLSGIRPIPGQARPCSRNVGFGPELALCTPHDVAALSPDPDPAPPRAPAEVYWGMSSVASRAGSELPDINDRLVEPETRQKMYDGGLVARSPPHP